MSSLATYLRDGRGESLRSLEAKDRGRYPASYIARRIGQGVIAADVAKAITPCEAHHTGSIANLTAFYDWGQMDDDAIDMILRARDERRAKAKSHGPGQYHIVYKEFIRSGKCHRWKCITHEYTGEATVRGQFIYFDGMKKRRDGVNIRITKLDVS